MKIKFYLVLCIIAALFSSCCKDKLEYLQKQIDELKSDRIASIETQITNINTTIAALDKAQTSLSVELKTLVADESKNLKAYVNEELKDNTDWVKATFATLEQYDALCIVVAQLSGQVSADIEATMKAWINEQLNEYYTIAQTQALIDSLAASSDSALKASIAEQKTALENAKAELKSSYEAAIQSAINQLSGQIDTRIANKIAVANTNLQTQINSIKNRLAAVEKDVEALLNQVQSIVVRPTYFDGSVKVVKGKGTLDFNISPVSLADSLAAAWNNAEAEERAELFSFNFIDAQTKVASDPTATITAVSADDGILKVSVTFSSLYKNTMTSLSIKYGKTEKYSSYFGLYNIKLSMTPEKFVQNGFVSDTLAFEERMTEIDFICKSRDNRRDPSYNDTVFYLDESGMNDFRNKDFYSEEIRFYRETSTANGFFDTIYACYIPWDEVAELVSEYGDGFGGDAFDMDGKMLSLRDYARLDDEVIPEDWDTFVDLLNNNVDSVSDIYCEWASALTEIVFHVRFVISRDSEDPSKALVSFHSVTTSQI